MKRLSLLLICCCLLISLQAQSSYTYVSSSVDFPNPERGFYYPTSSDNGGLSATDIADLRTPYSPWQATYQVHSTLLFRYYMLTPFVNGNISAAFLQSMADDFAAIRVGGAKVILRFSYTNTLTSPVRGDASKSRVLDHIDQLSDLLNTNADIIAAVQLGFIGTWGEGYYSDHFGDASSSGFLTASNWDDRAEVISALLNALPASRMIQVRYPQQKQKYVYGNAAPTTSAASGGRIGFHNDCFLASNTDFGTFTNYDPWSAAHANMVTDLRNYKSLDAEQVVVGGETCAANGDVIGDEMCSADGGRADTDLALFNYSFLNSDYNNAAVNNSWDGVCLDDIKLKLGYRFELINGTFSDEAQAGQIVNFQLNIQNVGYAAPFNPRGIEYILRNTISGNIYYASSANDPQQWTSGSMTTLHQGFCIPANMPLGNYELLLHLPDPELSLYGNPDYSIRLANQLPSGGGDVWEASTGYNKLGHTLSINTTATASSCNGETTFSEFSILPVNWLYFRAFLIDEKQLKLQWKTHTENNNKGFEIERSLDGVNFIKIGWVDAQGANQPYTFSDQSIGNNTTLFYRLRQIDWDGQWSYSPIVEVQRQNDSPLFSISPNPNNGHFLLESTTKGAVHLALYDLHGRKQWEQENFFNGASLNINTQLPTGCYYLRCQFGNSASTTKVIIE